MSFSSLSISFLETQNSTSMSGTTRVKTSSGQTIITRNSSTSDRPTTYYIRSSVRIHRKKNKFFILHFHFFFKSISPPYDADQTFSKSSKKKELFLIFIDDFL